MSSSRFNLLHRPQRYKLPSKHDITKSAGWWPITIPMWLARQLRQSGCWSKSGEHYVTKQSAPFTMRQLGYAVQWLAWQTRKPSCGIFQPRQWWHHPQGQIPLSLLQPQLPQQNLVCGIARNATPPIRRCLNTVLSVERSCWEFVLNVVKNHLLFRQMSVASVAMIMMWLLREKICNKKYWHTPWRMANLCTNWKRRKN